LSLNFQQRKITNINAFSCFGKLMAVLQLTLDLFACRGLLDLDLLSSKEGCVSLKKLKWTCLRSDS
jgi:hypothetical protein